VENWTGSLTMTPRSSITIHVEFNYGSAPLDFVILDDKKVFDKWVQTGTVSDKSAVVEYLQGVEDVDSTYEFKSDDSDYMRIKRVYFGLIASSTRKAVGTVMYYRHLAVVPEINCTNFTGGLARFPVNSPSVMEIRAPDECTGENSVECVVDFTLNPHWLLFLLIVVLPVVIVCVGVVIGLMALKALHTRQMVAYMRKKANEEGVALEQGKSKDIHAEKLKEGEDDDHPEPAEEAEETSDGDEPAKEEQPTTDSQEGEPSGSAVLSSGADGAEEH